MIFNHNKTYTETLKLAFGAINERRLSDVLRDGRPASHLLQAHLLSRFSNLRPAPARLFGGDAVVDDQDNVFLIRTVTKRGTTLLPSKNLGVGRKYDAHEHRAQWRQLHGYLLVDVTRMPEIRYGAVSKDIIPFQATFPYNDSISLLKLSETCK